jgi:integrase
MKVLGMDQQALAMVERAELVPYSGRADHNPAAVYLAGLSRSSRKTMRDALDVVAGIVSSGQLTAEGLPWAALRYQHTQAVRAALIERYAPATVNKHLAAIRGVLREAFRLGLMSAEDHARATDLPGIKSSTLPRGRALSAGELRALFRVIREDETAAGARDAALLAVLYGAGLRRAEAVALDVKDYDVEAGSLTVRAGKGRKDRIGYATNGSRTAIKAWLKVRGEEAGPLFVPVNKGGALTVSRMTPQAVLLILRKRAEQAGVASFSPHDLRRSFISDLLDNGADLATVQKLAGHSNSSTTARYDRRGEEAKRKAAELLHVPY